MAVNQGKIFDVWDINLLLQCNSSIASLFLNVWSSAIISQIINNLLDLN